MSYESLPPGRGGSMYEVTLLRAGINPRTATNDDFTTVCIRAANFASQLTRFTRKRNAI